MFTADIKSEKAFSLCLVTCGLWLGTTVLAVLEIGLVRSLVKPGTSH